MLRKIVKALVYIGLFLVLLIAAGVLYIATPYFSARAGAWLTHSSGRNVALDGSIRMHMHGFEPRFSITNVRVGNAEWGTGPTMFEAERIEASVRLSELLRGRIVLPELSIVKPKLLLEKNDKGAANWDFTENPQAAVVKQPVPGSRSGVPVIGHLLIEDGALVYKDPTRNVTTELKISTVEGGTNAAEAITLSGTGSYQKQPFTLEMQGDSVLQLKETTTPYHFAFKTRVGATSAEMSGTVSDPVKLAAVDVTLHLKGADAADLFPLTGIALPPSPAYDLSGHLTRDGDQWNFDGFKGKLGSSDLKGDVKWHPNEKTPYFEGNFVSDNLNMADLAGFVGGNKKPDDPNRVIPDTPLDLSRLMAMNADVNFHGSHIKTPDLLDDFVMNIHLKDGVLELKPLAFRLAKGTISADITVKGKETPPQATIVAHFDHLSLAALFKPLADKFGKDNVSAGTLVGEARLAGTGKSMQEILGTSNGTVDFAMEGGALSRLLLNLAGLDLLRSAGLLVTGDSPVPAHCVVGDFKVSDGMMNTQAFLIDTDVSTIRGKGSINLKNEALDLHLYSYPKKASLISARSPLKLDGTLKHPSAGVDKLALAERGGAAGLLALLAPPAALAAFLEPGLGKDSDCAKFVNGLSASTRHRAAAEATAPHPVPAKASQ